MSDRIAPALLALVGGAVLAVALFVPYVAVSYRRRGELGWGGAFLAAAALVYTLALVAYVLIPLPEVGEVCTTRIAQAGPQLRPFAFVADAAGYGIANPLRNPAILQVLFNVALFVPLGALVRYLGRRSVPTATAAGLAVSLLVEVTQLTGVWFLYPCPYRLFDVDDLIANTAGALAGALAGPLLRFVPGQRRSAEPGAPRPVTVPRRLLGIVCDLLAVWLTGALLAVVLRGILLLADREPLPVLETVVGGWVPWVLLFVLVPALGRGGTVGQRAVLLRPALPDGAVPPRWLLVVRSLAGIGGYALLQAADLPVAALWGVAGLLGILLIADRRGIGGALTGTVLVDRRAADRDLVRR